MVLGGDGLKAVKALLTGNDPQQAAAVARALGNSNNQKVLPLLTPLVTNPNLHANVRKEALKGPKVGYVDGQQVSLGGKKGQNTPKYIVEEKEEWDGGSRGKVITKGKRGPGFR